MARSHLPLLVQLSRAFFMPTQPSYHDFIFLELDAPNLDDNEISIKTIKEAQELLKKLNTTTSPDLQQLEQNA